MTSVNVWSRAVLAIVRKPIRSGLIGLLMLLVFTGLVAQAGVSAALQEGGRPIRSSRWREKGRI